MNLSEVLTIEYVITSIVETVSCGGNILVNIGPTKEGHIAPIFEERLRQMGYWLQVNGEAIYGTRPWKYQNDTTNPNVW
jgi:alpha-L-fucosidase